MCWSLGPVTLMAVLTAAGQPRPPIVAPPHVSAVWDDDQLLVSDTYTQPHEPHYLSALVRGRAYPEQAEGWGGELRVPYTHPTSGARGGISKIVARGDRLWVVGPGDRTFHAVPLDDLQFLEMSGWAYRRRVQKFGRPGVGVRSPATYFVSGPFAPRNMDEEERLDRLLEQPGVVEKLGLLHADVPSYVSHLVSTAHYDLVPAGADAATLVRASGGWLTFADVWLGRPIDSRKERNRDEVSRGPTKRVVAAPFDGDFWAYEVGGVYYLLTRTGAMYAVRRDGASWLGKAVKVWDEKDRPLVGAVQDVRGGTVYAFGPNGDPKRGGRFTFELAPKPDPAFYQTAAKPGDALREAQDCVAAVRKHLKRPEVPPPPRPAKP